MPAKEANQQVKEQAQTQAQQVQQAPQVPQFLLRLAQRVAKRKGITVDEALNLIEKYFDVPDEGGPLTSQARDVTGALLEYIKAKALLSDLGGNGDGKFDALIADLKGSLASTVQQLQAQIDDIRKSIQDIVDKQRQVNEEKVINMVKEEVTKQLSPLVNTLNKLEQYIAGESQRKGQEQLQEILKPILDKLDSLEARLSTVEGKEREVAGLKEQVSQLKGLLNEAKEALESLGYRVEGSKPITPDDLQKVIQQTIESLSPEQLKAIAEKKGLMVVDPKLPIDEVQKLVEEARQRAYQEAMQQNVMNGIKDFIDIVTNVAERVMTRLGPYMNNALATYAQYQRQGRPASPGRVQIEEVPQPQQPISQPAAQPSQQAVKVAEPKKPPEPNAEGAGK